MSKNQFTSFASNTGNDGGIGNTLTLPDIALAQGDFSAQHPFKNAANHEKLLVYLRQRLRMGMTTRDNSLRRLIEIDKDVSCWMQLSDEDRKRQEEKRRTGKPLVTQINLPISWIHLDDMMTYFAATFAPNRGMFYTTGKPDEIGPAGQLVTLMNNHAIYAGYYTETLKALYSNLKYNVGGFKVEWTKDAGVKLGKDSKDNPVLEQTIAWQGNRIESVDVYNFLPDPRVPVNKLHCDGEFCGVAKSKSPYWVQKKASQGLYFNCEEAFANGDWRPATSYKYYRNPPVEAQLEKNESGGTTWLQILSETDNSSSGAGMELVELYINLNPTQFGLIDGDQKQRQARARLETWRFTLLNDTWIIDATYMTNMHGWLPYCMGNLNDDMGTSQKSAAEILQPMQTFASSMLNIHIAASRKAIWGTTIYDPTFVDLSSIPDGEVAARIPCLPTGQGRDIRTAIWSGEGKLDTQETMQDLQAAIGILNSFFPTQAAPSQIANIDRAVNSQVAAVQQGANRRQQKAARSLDESIFRTVRAMMYYNIIQFQSDDPVTDYYTGATITLDLNQLRQTNMPFIIGQGLKAIDRQAAAQALQSIIFALIQSPQASQRIDLLGLIDYWTSMIDIDISMKQFELAPPQQQEPGTPGAADASAIGGAGGAPIQPAYAPSQITSPIHGDHGRPQ